MVTTKRFAEVLEDKPLFVPGIYDALSARIMEVNHFKAMYLSADCVAASFCGVPDACLMSSADLIDVVQRITALTTVPMLVDIDAGFGSEINVIRTCERVSACGAAAVCLSDKAFLRTAHSKQVMTREGYLSKLEAALYELKNTRCAVIARIDAAATLGLDEAIARANAAAALGAEAVCITGVHDREGLERICREVNTVCIYEMVSETEVTWSYEELVAMGFGLVWAPYVSLAGAMECVQELASDAYVNKNDFKAEERGYSTYAKFELLKIHEWYALGQKFNKNVQDAVDIDPDDYLKKQQAQK